MRWTLAAAILTILGATHVSRAEGWPKWVISEKINREG